MVAPRYLGIELAPADVGGYLADLGEAPSWLRKISLHHTWAPDEYQWTGRRSLEGIVRYWNGELGWTRYPQLVIAPVPGDVELDWRVFVVQDPREWGIGVRGRNRDSLHIEHVLNGDKRAMPAACVRASAFVVEALRAWSGVPVEWCDPHVDAARGLFFHRDRRDAGKTCPGTRVSHDAVLAAYHAEHEPEEEPMPIDVVHDQAAIDAAQAKLIAAGLLTRPHPGSEAASVGLLMILCARLLDQVGLGVDLEQYELRLVKKP